MPGDRLESQILCSFRGPGRWTRGAEVLSWNGWKNHHWPADIIRPGLRFYDAHLKTKTLAGLLEIVRGGSFQYKNKRAFEGWVHRVTGLWPDRNDPYWPRMAPRGTGLAIRCRVIKPLSASLPIRRRFPQLGWLHLGSATELDSLTHDAADLYEEGHRALRQHVSIERNPRLRSAAKTFWLSRLRRLRCLACAFDFEKRYGTRGTGFIELHHVSPVGSVQRTRWVHPDQLIPLCANCHRMVHRERDAPLTFDRLRHILRKA